MTEPTTRPGAMDRTSWWGVLSLDADGVLARLQHQFPVGSRIAVSSAVGDWSHDLSIEKVEEIKRLGPDHVAVITDRYVRGITGDEEVAFNYDYRGRRCTIDKKNGSGEPIRWIILAVEPEI